MVVVAASGPLALATTAAGYVAGSMNGRELQFSSAQVPSQLASKKGVRVSRMEVRWWQARCATALYRELYFEPNLMWKG